MKKFGMIAIFAFFISCNNAGEKIEVEATDSAAVAPVDTAIAAADSVNRPIINIQTNRKSANIAYSYFTTIKRNEVKHIMAYLSINKPEAKVKDTLRQIERTSTVNSENEDSSIINSLYIPLVYESIEISLIDLAGDYSITPTGHTSNKQRIDTVKGNKWDWSIITKTDKPSTTLILKITAYLSGDREELERREIPIRIKLEQNIIRKLWATLLDDPKYFLTVILVPLFAYFGKRYFDKKKASKRNTDT
jgi:hypothetical protein